MKPSTEINKKYERLRKLYNPQFTADEVKLRIDAIIEYIDEQHESGRKGVDG